MSQQNAYEIDLSEGHGKVDVRKNRRAWKYDLYDLAEATQVIRRHEGRGAQAVVIEEDGYRRKIEV